MSDKAKVRARIRALTQFSPAQVIAKSERICEAIVRDPAWKPAHTVAIFAPHTGEPDVELLWKYAAGKTLCYPRVSHLQIDFFAVSDPASLLVSRWKLREPVFEADKIVELRKIDLILVPGMAFTRDGQRLGRGGGYYDRLLCDEALAAVRLGVCFAVQMIDELPSEVHDMSVHRVITEL